MTIRTDIEIDWYENPRIANITTASNEITVQDSHDTLATIEDEGEGNQFPFLVSSAGKEALGGGTEVGITQTLQNVQYAPSRTAPRSTTTDTITTGGANTVICAGATFIADAVKRGDYVLNWTDQSVSEVLTITSETELQVRIPTGLAASSNDYAVSDVITIWQVLEFNLSGGNFVAINDADADIDPVFPVFGRFISKASASSATLQSQSALQFSSFVDGVSIDVTSIYTGTTFPVGTGLQPVNNLTDALLIANENGFNKLRIIGNLTIIATDNVDGFEIIGRGASVSTVTINAGASTIKTTFKECELTGVATGGMAVRNCHLEDLSGVGGTTVETSMHDCELENVGTAITMDASATEDIHIIDCFSGSPSSGPIVIDWNGTGPNTTIRKFAGGIKLTNVTNGQNISIDGDVGITVDSTCTNINLTIRGDTKITDNRVTKSPVITNETSHRLVWNHISSGGMTTGALIDLLEIIHARLDLNAGKPNVYNNDGSKITGTDFTLKKTVVGLTSTVQRL